MTEAKRVQSVSDGIYRKDGLLYSVDQRRNGEWIVIRPSWNGQHAGRAIVFGPFANEAAANQFVADDNAKAAA